MLSWEWLSTPTAALHSNAKAPSLWVKILESSAQHFGMSKRRREPKFDEKPDVGLPICHSGIQQLFLFLC